MLDFFQILMMIFQILVGLPSVLANIMQADLRCRCRRAYQHSSHISEVIPSFLGFNDAEH
jgi:hypothetical protein